MDMKNIVYPRSPRETMAGWVYLPRFIDKIRLHLAGKLHADYQENFARKGFDAAWLKAAGLEPETFIEVVKNTITDGEVFDWVIQHVKKTDAEKAEFNQFALNHGNGNDPALKARLQKRKEESGMAHRNEIQTFFDYIDADEKRL